MVVIIPMRYQFDVPANNPNANLMVPHYLELYGLFTDDLGNLNKDNFSTENREGIGEVYVIRSPIKDEVEKAHGLLSRLKVQVSPITESEWERPDVFLDRRR